MVRTQIQLTEEQARRLRELAHERRTSIAALIRDAVDGVLVGPSREERIKRALAVVGKYTSDQSGEANVAEEHDRYLDEAYLS